MIIFPNAKINIGLNVIEKRADGFHNIESIFYPVNQLTDVLEIVKQNSDKVDFSSSGIEIPRKEGELNLCEKAYQLIKNNFNISGVKIHLHKVIPIGAGLGGGSADAAFTLKVLNELFELNLSEDALIKYARKLGSDCAFFIKNKPVYAYHKGDEFEDVELDLSVYQIKIEYPDIHISTAEAYAGIVVKPSNQNLKKLITQPIDNWKTNLKNDFEQSVFPNHPKIENLKAKMYQDGAKFSSMTGSGSAVFGIF